MLRREMMTTCGRGLGRIFEAVWIVDSRNAIGHYANLLMILNLRQLALGFRGRRQVYRAGLR
jgi:hypothetical protein